jgi:hypothetical protein
MVRNSVLSMMLKPSALIMTAMLAGCAASSGLGGLGTLGEAGPDGAAPTPDAQVQLTALPPGETPPLPSRRPGKRPKAAARPVEVAAAQPAAPAEAPKPESSGGFSLASLGGGLFASTPASAEKAEEPESAPDTVHLSQAPVAAYSLLAQRIKYCWLNATSPRLPNHGFHADLAPGEIREAKMVVYEKAPDGRRGTSVFKVDITGDADGSAVSSRNVRLDKATEAGFKADLARWAKGDDRCKA